MSEHPCVNHPHTLERSDRPMSTDTEAERMPRPKKIDTALIGIVFAILLQCVTFVWWMATLNSRVDKLEGETAPVRAMTETIARLDERTRGMEITTQRIERKLDGAEAGR